MKKGTVRGILVRILILSIIFCASVVIMYKIFNQGEISTTRVLEDATLPLVTINLQDNEINELHGYRTDMQANYMRDSLTPLPNSHIVPIKINAFDNEINGLSYEIISPGDNTVVENKKVSGYKEVDGYITANLEIDNNIRMNQEYVLKIIVTVQNSEIFYYTRIIQEESLKLDDYVEFVNGFYVNCLNKDSAGDLNNYLESSDDADNTTLSKVTLNSSASQLTWGEMNVQLVSAPIPTIKELNPVTGSITLEYQVSSVDENGVTELYNVTEFYRLKYSDARVMLLNFEREVEELFDPLTEVISERGIEVGIGSKDIQYMTNTEGDTICFVKENELWSYNTVTEKLVQIFSFRKKADSDVRDSYNQHDVKIIKVDDSGSVDFIVYGYMNRGTHEGTTGVGAYHFDSTTGVVEELIFINNTQPYELINLDMGKLSYINSDKILYIMLGDSAYEIDLNTREYTVIVSDLKETEQTVSKHNQYFAWIDSGSSTNLKSVTVMNLEEGTSYNVTSAADESIRPLGFMGSDFVYGLAKDADIRQNTLGELFFPMYRIIIGNEKEIVKDYQNAGIYVTDVVFQDNLMSLVRVKKSEDGSYGEELDDHIMNNNEAEVIKAGIITNSTDRKQLEIVINLAAVTEAATPKVVWAEYVIFEEIRELTLAPADTTGEYYYVYAKGRLDSIYKNANTAIVRADELLGVVVTRRLEYVWERGNLLTAITIDTEEIPEVMKQGTLDMETISAGVEGTVVNLSGCTLEQVKYFISESRPVVVKKGDEVWTIIGYDLYGNYKIYIPSSGEIVTEGPNDCKKWFENSGNIFISYIKAWEN